jgi:hypothetical protein
MNNFLHRWLLVYLYHWAIWLKDYAHRLQVALRHTLLLHASRSYNPPTKPRTKAVIPWQQRLAEAEKAGKPISPVKHRVKMPLLHCQNCGAPVEYLYNFGYEHGHGKQEAFHKTKCKICGFQTVQCREKRSPHFFCPYCGYAIVKTKERRDFDVLKCKNIKCPYRHDSRLRIEAIRNGASPQACLAVRQMTTKARAYIYRSFKMEVSELQLTRPEKPKIDFAQLRHSTTAVALALTFAENQRSARLRLSEANIFI